MTQSSALPAGFERYGLQRNPFAWSVPLDPVTNPDDTTTEPCMEDGFGQLALLEDRMQSAVDDKRPYVVVVEGSYGTGRTSFANHVLARYRDMREVERSRFVRVPHTRPGDTPHCDGNELLSQIARDVCMQLHQWNRNDADDVHAKFVAWERERSSTLASVPYSQTIGRLTRDLASAPTPMAVGILVKNVPAFQVIDSVIEAFGTAQTVAVFTVEHSNEAQTRILTPFQNLVRERGVDWPIVTLDHLHTDQVGKLVSLRWQQASAGTWSPFRNDAVEVTVGRRARPAGNALHVMWDVAEQWIKTARPGPPWPDGELEIDPQKLGMWLKDLDRPWYR